MGKVTCCYVSTEFIKMTVVLVLIPNKAYSLVRQVGAAVYVCTPIIEHS